MISFSEMIIEGITLVLGFACSLLVILVWSNRRTVLWLFIMFAVLVDYLGRITRVLQSFGIIPSEYLTLGGFPVVDLVVNVFPLIFLIIGFAIQLSKSFTSLD